MADNGSSAKLLRKFRAAYGSLGDELGSMKLNEKWELAMFSKTILAAVASVAFVVAPGVGTTDVDAHPYPHHHHHHHPRPLIVCPRPVIVSPIVVTPVAVQYDVYYRLDCNAPWTFSGTFDTRFDADQKAASLQVQKCETTIIVR